MNKKVTVLLTLIIIITFISTVNATNNTETQQQYTNQVKQTNNMNDTTTKEVSTYKELTETINNAKKSDSKNYIINMKKGEYNITNQIIWSDVRGNVKTLIINGENSTINGNSKNFIKIGLNCSVKINNLLIKNTSNLYGSAIYNFGDTIINNTRFENNHVTSECWGGGSVLNLGNINIANSSFINNTGKYCGGAICNLNNIKNLGKMTINNCYFANNTALMGSAICNLQGNFEVNNSEFIQNSADDSIIYINNTNNSNSFYSINNSIIKNNTSNNSIITNEANLIISNSDIMKNMAKNAMITNKKYLNLLNTNTQNNTSKKDLILNNGTFMINYSNITYNVVYELILNYNNTIINNSNISYNNINNLGISNNQKLTIEKSLFRNNSVYNTSLVNDNVGETRIISSKFYDNKCLDLFTGTNQTFTDIENNTYLGNNLRFTTLTVHKNNHFNYDNNITIKGTVKTNLIYNTTINSGIITLYLNNTIIDRVNVINGTYNFNKYINQTGILNIKIIYNGKNNYITTENYTNISIEIPSYNLSIITNNKTYNYKDSIKYTIIIINKGLGNGSNITINNIVPKNLEYVNSSDSKNIINNSWHINRLNSGEIKNITIESISNTKEDINISIFIINPQNKKNITLNQIIKYLKPVYVLDIQSYNDSYRFNDYFLSKIKITNIGNGTGYDMKVNINLKNKNKILENKTLTFTKINPNEMKIINLTCKLNTTGLILGNINLNNSNMINTLNFNFTVLNPYISLDNILAHPGDTINITAKINNLNMSTDKIIIFKLNYKTIKSHNITIKNNTITLLNYIIPDNIQTSHNILEIKYSQKNLISTLYNNSSLNLVKYDVYCKINNILVAPGDYTNITVKLFDENNNKVTNGRVVFKINKKTIKDENNHIIYINVVNGIAKLSNFKIPITFNNEKYTIDIIYSGSNKYVSCRNNSNIILKHQDILIEITNTTFTPGKNYTIMAKLIAKYTNRCIYGGNIVFKINDITISKKISVKNNTITFTYFGDFMKINNITVCYSGNKIYNPIKASINYIVTNLNKNMNLSYIKI